MKVNIKIEDIRSIEHIAMCLLSAGISFEYSEHFLVVKNSDILTGMSASYHVGEGNLCLMDSDHNLMTVKQFVKIIKPELKPFAKIVEQEEITVPPIYELVKMVQKEVSSNKYLTNPDCETIEHAKKIAKKYKIPYQSILCHIRPSGRIVTPVWDAEGKIVPYKKIFY